MTLSQRALSKAITQLGKKEEPIGSNWGAPVKDYLKSVGINFPASWCMAFVYWCYNNSLNEGEDNPLVKTGGVLAHWNKADDKYKTQEPKVGDIFIMDFGKGLGHTGIVEKVDGNILHTIEANTNDDGSREGYKVCRRVRKRSKIKGYLSY